MNVNKIIISLVVIGAVAAIAVGGTIAYFSDTKTSVGNIISAGTIAIAVDQGVTDSHWSQSYTEDLKDMKPGMTREITFTVKNTGTNPIVLRKQIGTFVLGGTLDGTYCAAQGGTMSGTACLKASPVQDLSNVITYDMTVTQDAGTPIVMIPESYNVKMSDVKDLWVPLGPIEPDHTLTVTQSYHFDEATGNWAQGDTLTFNISLYAEQVGGIGPNTTTGVVLDNKNTTSWASIVDGTLGILTWDGSGNYKMRAFGLNNSLTYRVAYWNGSTETPIDVVFGVPVSGQLTLTGTYLGFTTNVGAKYWLRPTPWSSLSDVNTLYEGNVVKQP